MAKAKKKTAARKKSGSNNSQPENPKPIDDKGRISVLIEMRQGLGQSGSMAMSNANSMSVSGFELDHEFEPVELGGPFAGAGMETSMESYVCRGTVKTESQLDKLRAQADVAEVWKDTPIAPFPVDDNVHLELDDNLGSGICPIGTCDCDFPTPKGNMADVATYLGVDRIWGAGFRGNGITVGVLDSGITALGRPVKPGETSRRIPRVVDGWPSDWGTESSKWGNHGNMVSTDVLGMAPQANIYDLRIAGSGGSPGTISRALQAFQWAINRHRLDGTPHILSNSWGIFQESWDATYARNPNHPFTRKVVEAMNEGIIVLFAAGNCGSTCPDGRCGPDNGPGRSIWGANSHERVMTVGAVNKNEQFVGYSSQGPGALHADKPDFCSITHFTGYNTSDGGTSAATPIAAGVCALLKDARGSLTHDQIKQCLMDTAKDIGPSGFDRHSGAGIIQAWDAYQRCGRGAVITIPAIDTSTVRDRITLASRDRITSVLRDTSVRADRLSIPSRETTTIQDRFTGVGRDTSPTRDVIGTNVLADRRDSAPRIDWVKQPRLDTLDERLRRPPVIDRFPRPTRGIDRPLVLSTPHHAAEWQEFDEGTGAGDELGDLEMQIAELQGQLNELIDVYHAYSDDGGGCCDDLDPQDPASDQYFDDY